MLLQLSVENYKSINKQIIFSMLKTKDNLHNSYVRNMGDFKILPNSLIIGTNGAGKSNLFKSVEYLQKLLNGKNDIEVFPHKLSNRKNPTRIDIQFLISGTRYAYGIDVLSNQVVFEYLTVYDHNKEFTIFERVKENYKFIETAFSKKCPKNHAFLTILNESSKNEYVKHAYNFLTKKIYVISCDEDVDLFNDAILNFHEPDNKKIVNKIIQFIDIGINSFYLKNDEIYVSYNHMDINILEESSGTKKLFTILVMLCDVLLDGKIVLFDELEKNLHITLVKHIINLFNKPTSNNQNAQLIFSTHNTSLLNLANFRKDQIWFMEKDFDTMTTDLYSLYNIIDVQENEDIEKGYIFGKYGATFKFSHDEVTLYGK